MSSTKRVLIVDNGFRGPKGDPGTGGGIAAVVAGTNVSVDSTDPTHPVVNATASVGTVASTGITDATTVGKAVLTASSQANARSAIGAGTGTSTLALGTSGSTAMAGNTTLDVIADPVAAVTMNAQKITGVADPTSAQDAATKAYADALAALALNGIVEVSGTYPNRPAGPAGKVWIGLDAPATGGSTSGGTPKSVPGDLWLGTVT